MNGIRRSLTIAGSDSGGGAGIQADLKTFAALGVYGMSAITAITAQNTTGVTAVHDIPVEIIRAQIDAVVSDIGVDSAKTGMLHSTEIIGAVANAIKENKIQTVVDPVMIAKSGAKLLKDSAIDSLKKDLIPLAKVVTPNAMEAQVLSGMKVRNLDEAKAAAKKIAELGSEAVVVKGGHIPEGNRAVDTLYFEGSYQEFSAVFVNRVTDHGTGCSFSAAIAAELAKGHSVPDAVGVARRLITIAIRHGIEVGKGHGPVNPMAELYRQDEKLGVLEELRQAVSILEGNQNSALLIPESQSNIAMSLSDPESPSDVAAIPGRIVRIGNRVQASAPPEFGASRHVASAILTAMRFDPSIRAGMNVAYVPTLAKICDRLGLALSSYDRGVEPEAVRGKEGGSVPWGTEQAIMKIHRVPDVLIHTGDYGKEPMALILGKTPSEVATKALQIADALRNTET